MDFLDTATVDHADDSIINVVAIDSGSGSIKIGVAHVDTTTNKVHDTDYSQLAIQLAKDLEAHNLIQEINKSGQIQNLYNLNDEPLNICDFFNPDLEQENEILNIISPMSSKDAHDFLEKGYANKFSEAIKDIYVTKISDIVKKSIELDPKHPTEVWLVGTAALRKADDGQYLVDALEQKINEDSDLFTNFKIISQDDEGIYAFEGGVAKLGLSPDQTIAWDIGGGSMQITGKQNDDYEVLGGVLASATYKHALMENLIDNGIKSVGESIYPLDANTVEKAIDLAKSKLSFGAEKEQWFSEKKSESGTEIIGIGNIHSSILNLMKHCLGKLDMQYSQNDLKELITLFTGKSLAEIESITPKNQISYAEQYFGNMLLVAATMEKYSINNVTVVPISNVNTLLYKAAAARN